MATIKHANSLHEPATFETLISFHEPCVLPDGIVDDVASPIQVNVTHAQDFDKNDDPLETTTLVCANTSVLKQGILEEPSATDDLEMESGDEPREIESDDEHVDHDNDDAMETHLDQDACDSLLKPDDMDAHYISDEDLIEKGDFVKGERKYSDEYFHEAEENQALSGLPDDPSDAVEVERSGDKEDEIIESSNTREDVDDELDARYVDESEDEFLALEKQLATECEQTDSGIPSDIEHGVEELTTGYDEYMQAMQDLSSRNNQKEKALPFPASDDEVRSCGVNQSAHVDTQSVLSQDQANDSDLETSVAEATSEADAENKPGQESTDVEGNNNSVSKNDVTDDDDGKEDEPRGHPSVSDADFQSGNESISTDGPSDIARVDDTESDDDVRVYECTSDLPEGTVTQSECDEIVTAATEVLKDENNDDTTDKSFGDKKSAKQEEHLDAVDEHTTDDTTDKSFGDKKSEKQEEHLDAVDEHNKDVLESNDENQGTEMASSGAPGFPSDDKDEKCKIS